MMENRFERLPITVAVGLTVLSVGACAIRLSGDESASQSSALLISKGDAPAAKLDRCRTVTYEEKDTLLECQKIWAEQRKKFLKAGGSSSRPDNAGGLAPFSSPVSRKDESRILPGSPSVPSQSE